jgi:hypothetical protein
MVVFFASIAFIYESPKYSWNPAVRDHDGDGVPDKLDPRPYDAGISGIDVGFINLTIENHEGYAYGFLVRAWSSNLTRNLTYSSPDIEPNGTLNTMLNISWWTGSKYAGDNAGFTIYITAPTGPSVGDWKWGENQTVENGKTLRLSLVLPDDFYFMWI